MDFASDNGAGVAPEILEAIAASSRVRAPAYGADDFTARSVALLSEAFETEVAAFLVPTGTGANALALSALGPDGNSSASVPVSVGTTWTKFAVTLTVTHSSSNELLMQLNESAGQTAYFDGAVLH